MTCVVFLKLFRKLTWILEGAESALWALTWPGAADNDGKDFNGEYFDEPYVHTQSVLKACRANHLS